MMKETEGASQSEADLRALLSGGHDGICCVQLSLTAESFGVSSTQGPGYVPYGAETPEKGKAHIERMDLRTFVSGATDRPRLLDAETLAATLFWLQRPAGGS